MGDVNKLLLAHGYARAYIKESFEKKDEYEEIVRISKENNTGL